MYQRILIPLDGSELAEDILPHAEALARAFKAEVVLLQVISAYPVSPHVTAPMMQRVEDVERLAREEATAYLTRIEEWLQVKGIRVQKIVSTGEVAGEILEQARHHGCDLIAMMTHGRSGLGRWVFGSVADKILQRACCPVLLVRAGQAPVTTA